MADDSLWVEVVSADGRVWEGEALSVVARTTEGDIGILSRHEPILGVLVPCAAEVLTTGGERKIVAVDGGFLSVNDNKVSILSQYATLAETISLHEAELEMASAAKALEAGNVDEETKRHYNRAAAQFKAAQKASSGLR
ncbi:F0F1 ATP synthase subunit epsilon [Propioniciclava tarda]|uniref:ATP synthase epsilon chain n=1 Tax=Propioniciclava tarda TaxID=433330 RepID=A0A4Q9KL10_PROTD|nr:F0F1 ATP synthase subunit epsilon [Propioniciclava tarda]TBT95148.1 F0F1 ATP synthase subunit epsilon [Propioniciclava tarda]SMO51361.1 F-type H+-transporting ATPase subunit epsilon [Propioniciclava tarda]